MAYYPTDTIRDLQARNWLGPLFDEAMKIYLDYFKTDQLARKVYIHRYCKS